MNGSESLLEVKKALITLVRINRSRRRLYIQRGRRAAKLHAKHIVNGVVYDFDIHGWTASEELLLAMTRKLYSLARKHLKAVAAEAGFRVEYDANNSPTSLVPVKIHDEMARERTRLAALDYDETKRRHLLSIRLDELWEEFPSIKVRDIIGGNYEI